MREKPRAAERPTPNPRRPSTAGKPPVIGPNRPNGSGSAPSKMLAASGPKSLMKTSAFGAGGAAERRAAIQPAPGSASIPAQRRKPAPGNISGSRQQKIEERIAAATEERL